MDTYVVRILPGGRITIPAAIRRMLDLHPGDSLVWLEQGGEIHIRKAEPSEIASGAANENSTASAESGNAQERR